MNLLQVIVVVIIVELIMRHHYHRLQHVYYAYIQKCGKGCTACKMDSVESHECPVSNVNHPMYNVRQAAKQCVLLEDHMEHPEKRCIACIKKHNLILEGLFEEAIGLDRHNQYVDFLEYKPARVRSIFGELFRGGDYKLAAQKVRDLRRECVDQSYNFFDH